MDRRVRALRALEALLFRDDAVARRAAGAVDDWPLLFARARHHAVAGHLRARLAALGVAPPLDVARALARRDVEDELWFLHLAATLADVAAGLSQRGVPYVALKGPALAVRVASPPHLRRSTDLDVLVAPDDVGPAVDALSGLGYARLRGDALRDHAALHFAHATLPGLELHHAAHVGVGRAVPASALLDGAREVDVLGAAVRIPPAAPELAYLALHAAGHRFERLSWLLDVSVLLDSRTVDLPAARDAAARLGAARALDVALAEIARAKGERPERGALARLVTAGEERASSSEVRAALNTLSSTALADSPLDAARFIASKLRRDLAPRLRQTLRSRG